MCKLRFIGEKLGQEYLLIFKTREHEDKGLGVDCLGNMRTWVWLGLQPNTRSLRYALLWNGELLLAEQASAASLQEASREHLAEAWGEAL